jgi:hypothetical protein
VYSAWAADGVRLDREAQVVGSIASRCMTRSTSILRLVERFDTGRNRRLLMRALIMAALLSAVAGSFACSRAERGRLRGYVRRGPEEVTFHPCGSREGWWISVNRPHGWLTVEHVLASQPGCNLMNAGNCVPQEAFIEGDGQVTAPGHYGHMGMYQREVRLSRIHWADRGPRGTCRE